jgi:phosphoglycerol transferase MdoB-like AlkP superfamily enzyme
MTTRMDAIAAARHPSWPSLVNLPRQCSAAAFSRGIAWMLCVLLVLVAQFQLLRLGLLWANRELAQDTASIDIARSFLFGLRFDLATAAHAVIPLLLVATCVRTFLVSPSGERRVYIFGGAFLGLPLWLLGLAEVEFYREFFSRYNSLALHYWSQPLTVLRMIWHGFPVVSYLLFVAALWLSQVLVLRWIARPWRYPAPALPKRRMAEVLRAAAALAVLVVLARGGVRGTPLKWGDAVHCQSTFANHLALNGFWTLGNAILSGSQHDYCKSMWKRPMSAEEAHERARKLLLLPGDELADDTQRFPLLRRHSPASRTVSLAKAGTPPNVVVIIMESFTARFCGACGAGTSHDDHTPEFNRLAAAGILFDCCFSAGTHTHQANVGVTAGFPNLPGHEALMEDFTLGTQQFDSLPRAFKQKGYETWLMYNGALEWENMRGFYSVQGVDYFVGRDDFDSRGHFDSTWGVSDADLFDRANREFAKATQPFYATLLTLSNHAPFDLPRPLPFAEVTDQGCMNARMNGVRYADWALGQFFDKARREPYFNNTLFVLVGDHGFSIAPLLTELRLLRFHVPLLFYSPGLLGDEGRTLHTVASQLDIGPTILGLVGDSEPHQHWGRDLFALSPDDAGMAVFKPSERSGEMGFARGDLLLVKSNDGRTRLYRYSLGFPARASPLDSPDEMANMDRDLQAYVTSSLGVLRGRSAAPQH